MPSTKESVLRNIRIAFKGVVLGKGTGLFEAQGLDDYADEATCKAYREKDEKNDWERISAEDLNHCYSSPCFFDAEGMRFYLPAFLVAELEGKLSADPVFHLTHLDDYAKGKLALLSRTQREAVRDFLLFIEDDPNYEPNKPAIEYALANYWLSQEH